MENALLARGPAPARALPTTHAQAQVLSALDRFRAPATVAELSAATGQHGNTVREHLDGLLALGLVERHRAPARGRGRPSYRYLAAALPAQRPAVALVAALAGVLRAAHPDAGAAAAAARTLGQAADTTLDAEPAATTDQLIEALAALGFDPEVLGDGSVRLRTCPLVDLARADVEVVCGFHQGLVDRLAGPRHPLRLHPFAESGACTLTRDHTPKHQKASHSDD